LEEKNLSKKSVSIEDIEIVHLFQSTVEEATILFNKKDMK
jgi:hypothetical protein